VSGWSAEHFCKGISLSVSPETEGCLPGRLGVAVLAWRLSSLLSDPQSWGEGGSLPVAVLAPSFLYVVGASCWFLDLVQRLAQGVELASRLGLKFPVRNWFLLVPCPLHLKQKSRQGSEAVYKKVIIILIQ
jgi:hypothetical protein